MALFMKPLNQYSSLELRYEKAIIALLDVAMNHSDSRAKVCGSILLSAAGREKAPGKTFCITFSELTYLDDDLQHAAMGVIHGRTSLRLWPQMMIQDGDKVFRMLWLRWINVEDWPSWYDFDRWS
jgi:hypothetical protein